jgi:hypothetical protein
MHHQAIGDIFEPNPRSEYSRQHEAASQARPAGHHAAGAQAAAAFASAVRAGDRYRVSGEVRRGAVSRAMKLRGP